MIEWITAHAESVAGCRLVFSSPERFFRAVAGQAALLPLVTGELQHHAIGCYSVQRGIKTRLRRAEHLLRQAELAGAGDADAERLEEAWQQVAFNQFHDTLGGTSIPSAYVQQYDQLGAAATVADDMLHTALRRKMLKLPDDPLQRIVLFNPSDAPFDGYTEHEPYLRTPWQANIRLLDEAGNAVPYQRVQEESVNGWLVRLLFPLQLDAGALRVIRIDPHGTMPAAAPSPVEVSAEGMHNERGIALRLAGEGALLFPALQLPLPRLDLLDDRTDNWSHSVDRYPEGPVTSPGWSAPCALDDGPLLAALLQTGRVGDSTLRAEWRLFADAPFIELRLTINWRERNKLLKMTLPLPASVPERLDGIPGAHLTRANSGVERPLRDWTRFTLGDKVPELHYGVVCPEVYALDATARRARLTLLRSPLLTQHEPNLGMAPRGTVADQGEHHFLFRFFCGADVTPELLDRHSLMLHRPLLAADLTRGMVK